ncbi:hypothetical protein [Quadrisphaera sp. INWT6]|uniref:hypothetical protein n=1 Tax=Quadrisphaera sp. INWT6 TaxID=2596917 RepID=UPI0018924C9E|nr:hypothetical protein [Quadrisphaera sp. INWT6]MBF5083014.1 hypothetical protein [Quadrisphaera sp. INWT6]
MSASPVVDLDSWRERARVVRSAEAPAAAPAETAATASTGTDDASVVRMPAPAGPLSVFGPVMAFGLVRRSTPSAGQPRAVHAPHLDALRASGGEGPDAARRTAPAGPPELRLVPALSEEPAVTSAPAPRLHVVPDTRGSSRGPRR